MVQWGHDSPRLGLCPEPCPAPPTLPDNGRRLTELQAHVLTDKMQTQALELLSAPCPWLCAIASRSIRPKPPSSCPGLLEGSGVPENHSMILVLTQKVTLAPYLEFTVCALPGPHVSCVLDPPCSGC